MTPPKVFILVIALAWIGLSAPGSQASLISNSVGFFTGGDSGEGLDLSGNFVYAVNLGEPSSTGNLTIGDATFKPSGFNAGNPTGVSFGAPSGVDLAVGGGSLGASSNDLKIINVMNNIIFANKVTYTFTVTSGQYYKIQLLMTYTGLAHKYDVAISTTSTTPTIVYTAFDDKAFNGGSVPSNKQVVFTFEVTAPGSTISIFTQNDGGTNTPLPAAITIETPEPASLTLLAVGGVAMLRRRRRRRNE